MGTRQELLSRVCWAQTHNSTLSSDELRRAADLLAEVAASEGLRLMPVDEAGDRLIGAALVARDDLPLVDASRRLDGEYVLLVAGHVAGAVGVALKASLARALGAVRVDAAILGGWSAGITDCERVWNIARMRHERGRQQPVLQQQRDPS
jgi:hypothetical protein